MSARDESGNPLVGFVDVGGALVPRAELARMVPDVSRFERYLADALTLDAVMDANGGTVPEYVQAWPMTKRNAVAVTLHELGMLASALADNCRTELAHTGRTP